MQTIDVVSLLCDYLEPCILERIDKITPAFTIAASFKVCYRLTDNLPATTYRKDLCISLILTDLFTTRSKIVPMT